MIGWSLHLCIAAALATAPGEQLRTIPAGATFIAPEDSLGYEEFRALSPDGQREAREHSRKWLATSRDALRVSEGRRPSLPWRFPNRPKQEDEYEEFLHLALDYAATAVGFCPYDAQAWLQYAEVALRLARDDIAAACATHALKANAYELDPELREANRAEIHRVQAFASFNLKEYVTAKEAATAFLEGSPRAWLVRLIAARSALRLGQYSEAHQLSNRVPEVSDNFALARSIRGAAELGLGNHDAAGRDFEEAARRGLETPEFANDRGRLCLAVDRPEEAAAHFREALRLEPSFCEAACNLATAHRRRGDPFTAERVLVTQLYRVPGNGPVHFALAETYRDLARSAEGDEQRDHALLALEQYNLAVENGASADQVLERRASLVLYLDGAESIEEYILALAAERKASAHVLAVLARVKQRQGRLDIAEGILAMAASQDDATALVFAEYGEVLLRRGRIVEAREALSTACAMDHGLVVSRINLSLACELLGDMPAARAALDEAIARDPQHPLVLERIDTAGKF